MGARPRSRDPRRDDLGPDRRGGAFALAPPAPTRGACTGTIAGGARARSFRMTASSLRFAHDLAGPPHRRAADASTPGPDLGVPRLERRWPGRDGRGVVPLTPLECRAVRGHRPRGVHGLPGGTPD